MFLKNVCDFNLLSIVTNVKIMTKYVGIAPMHAHIICDLYVINMFTDKTSAPNDSVYNIPNTTSAISSGILSNELR